MDPELKRPELRGKIVELGSPEADEAEVGRSVTCLSRTASVERGIAQVGRGNVGNTDAQ